MTVRHSRTLLQNVAVPPRTLIFVHAHPDDEALLTAGTMARAVSEGHRVVLVMATDGAAGLTASDMTQDLVTHRARELQASADVLGVSRVVHLGYADSGLSGDVPDAFVNTGCFTIGRSIASIIDEEGADVIVGYDPTGGYGHPDHVHVHRSVRTAMQLCVRRPHLYESTLPREPIVWAVHTAARLRITPSSFDPREFNSAWTPRAHITHRVDVRRFLDAKLAALRAHASQSVSDSGMRTVGVLGRLPRPVARLLLGTEYYVRVATDTTSSTRDDSSNSTQ
ncbi:MAG: PIG-L family deacetylase [Actinobacteria bacterium]|nr:PIG-L family deacetylase [Actinomycetota bacterium]